MENGGGGGVCSSETMNGGEDVFSCENSDASSVDHLLIMVHGILGSTTDWKFGAEQFVRRFPDKVFVHCSERNIGKLTLDGVDVMGERLSEEVLEVIKRKPGLKKISFVSHSVGGLVARYAIGRLYRPPRIENTEDLSANACVEGLKGCTIAGLEPVNFVTVATPHLGSRGNKQVPFLFGVTALEKAAFHVIHLIFKRTGRHLFLCDNDEGRPPLLKRMVEDDGELHFVSALRSFKHRVAYSNVGYDHVVGWRTSSIRRNNELPKWEDSLNEKYPHIVYEEHCKACDGEQGESVVKEDDSLAEIKLANSYFYDKALCTLAWKLFLPEGEFDLDHPAANPLTPGRGPPLKRMPPTLTVIAEHDWMKDRAIAYSEELRKVNVDAPVLEYKDAVHEFATLDMLLKTPQAQACAEDIAIWVKKYISLRGHEFSY